MRFWNGIVMYAPQPPDFYSIPAQDQCIFRLLQQQGDTQAWNLYWLSQPQTDLIPLHRMDWRRHYKAFSAAQTQAFYAALDSVVLNGLTLATVVAQPPRDALRLITRAHLERTPFYVLADGEVWRQVMLGRLFLAERINSIGRQGAGCCEVIPIDLSAGPELSVDPEPSSRLPG